MLDYNIHPKRVLITGGSGFIGSSLIERLGANGAEVYALLRPTSKVEHLKGTLYQRRVGDLSDVESLKKAVQGVDVIYHLAGAVAAPNREGYFRHNAQGTENLLQACAEANPNLQRFVFVSSLAASGPAPAWNQPRQEHEEPAPISAYGESKLAAEAAVLKFRERFPVAIVRPPIVYGPRDQGIFVLIKSVAQGLVPIVRGGSLDGTKFYSAIHCFDLCDGIERIGNASATQVPSGEIFFLSGDDVFTYDQFIDSMAAPMKKKPIKLRLPSWVVPPVGNLLSLVGRVTGKTYPMNADKVAEIQADYWVCSNRKAKEKVGFKPQFTIVPGMQQTIEWYLKEKWL